MAAKTNAEYKRDQRAKAAKLGVVNMTLPVTQGLKDQLDELCARHDFEDWRELLNTVVRNLHNDYELGRRATVIPAIGFEPSKVQLAELQNVKPNCWRCNDTGVQSMETMGGTLSAPCQHCTGE